MDKHLIKKYAEVIVGIGVNVQEGDNVPCQCRYRNAGLSSRRSRMLETQRGDVITIIKDDRDDSGSL